MPDQQPQLGTQPQFNQSDTTGVLQVDSWQNAMADSPAEGFGLIKNASIDAVSGAVIPNYKPASNSLATASTTGTFSGADGVSKVFTLSVALASLVTVAVPVTFATTGTLPTGLTAGNVYFLFLSSGSIVKVAASVKDALNGTAISLTGNGTGTITVSTVDMGIPNSIVTGNGSITYVADSNGRVWFDDTSRTYLLFGNTLTSGTGHGIAVFTVSDLSLTFLFVYRNALLDVCDVTTSTKRNDPVGNSSWTNGFAGLNAANGSSTSHQTLLSTNNIVYNCDMQYVGSFQEVPGKIFSPSDATTYVFNSQALTLPANDVANCLEQLGGSLLVGGIQTNFIYPWDRISPTYDLPIRCPEKAIYNMVNIGNIVYIAAGQRGNIYKTAGYFVSLLRKIPEYLMQATGGNPTLVTWGGMGIKNGALIVGVAGQQAAYDAVYLIYPDGRLVIDNTPSQGGALPTVISKTTTEFYYIGYSGWLDYTSLNRWGSFGTDLQSQLYNIGTKVNQATYSVLEVQLDRPGANGNQVRISYRANIDAAWTVLATYTADGAATSFDSDIGLTGIENIQLRAELSGAGSGSNAIQMRYVRLRP